MSETEPISFVLRRIIQDPATNKLLTTIFSTILIISCAENERHDWNMFPLIVIFGISLIYSALSLAVVIFKKQESVTNSGILKKIFRGRTIFLHEIQTTGAFALAIANISGIVLAGVSRAPMIQILFSTLNIFFFSLEWYFAAENGKSFVTEENPKMGHNCLDCILNGIHTFPLFFNFIRNACLIAALVLVAANQVYGNSVTYFIYCTAFAIAGSFLLFVLQTSGTFENSISTKLVSGRKWNTYLMLIIVVHAFLAVLTLSLVVDNTDIRRGIQESQPVVGYYYDNDYYNRDRYYNNRGKRAVAMPSPTPSETTSRTWSYYNNNNNEDNYYNGSRIQRRRYGNQKSTKTPYQKIYETPGYTRYIYENRSFNAPIESPISFALSCVVLILSALDLYARAIYSRSRRDNEATSPLYIQTGINKVEDLPISFASPHTFDNPNKQINI
uniref:Uncharacterized protein n=1 Tax=Panagrolaimus sp. ES5 TaxID=591445 RepID=A0AC34F079_9BILA